MSWVESLQLFASILGGLLLTVPFVLYALAELEMWAAQERARTRKEEK